MIVQPNLPRRPDLALRLGLLGAGIGHSRSPVLHTEALRLAGLPGSYQLYDRQDEAGARQVLDLLRDGQLDGLNVTTPWKTLAAEVCQPPKPLSVNTLWRGAEGLYGESTDGPGLLQALAEAQVPLDDRLVVLLGAGGTAAALVPALCQAGVRQVSVTSRREAQARSLVEALADPRVIAVPWGQVEALAAADLVLHTTRFGHGRSSQEPELQAERQTLAWLPWPAWTRAWLFDVVYADGPTWWETLAIDAGLPVDRRLVADAPQVRGSGLLLGGGLAMLAAQGALSFQRWTGVQVPAAALRQVLRKS